MAMLSEITLTQLYCDSTSEPGSDEAFFKVEIDNLVVGEYPTNGTPHSISGGNFWPLDVTYAYTESVKISLWDSDGSGSSDDLLGSYVFTAGSIPSSPVPLTNPSNGASYQLSFKIATCNG